MTVYLVYDDTAGAGRRQPGDTIRETHHATRSGAEIQQTHDHHPEYR